MPKYKQIKINLKEEDYFKLVEVATRDNVTLAELFRRSVDINIENTPKIKKLKSKIFYKQTNPHLVYEVHKIGLDIHTIVKNLSNSKDELKLQTLYRIYEKVMSL